MGRSCFLRVLLVLALLALSFSHGISTKVMETVEITRDSSVQAEESGGKSRELMEEMMDYQLEPGPNTNPTTGSMLAPPPQR
ncbi:hypothetical protein MANES_01G092200v8 [Manihot esculenta]|uniref:Uncharacterized protein n=1 Tax=Manihot esculenta TaxID=3983 RepID=A0A2C9WKL8_MANES|nr:hypothetical protein MANES_01G092200v8 [Manihot esculenta]